MLEKGNGTIAWGSNRVGADAHAHERVVPAPVPFFLRYGASLSNGSSTMLSPSPLTRARPGPHQLQQIARCFSCLSKRDEGAARRLGRSANKKRGSRRASWQTLNYIYGGKRRGASLTREQLRAAVEWEAGAPLAEPASSYPVLYHSNYGDVSLAILEAGEKLK